MNTAEATKVVMVVGSTAIAVGPGALAVSEGLCPLCQRALSNIHEHPRTVDYWPELSEGRFGTCPDDSHGCWRLEGESLYHIFKNCHFGIDDPGSWMKQAAQVKGGGFA